MAISSRSNIGTYMGVPIQIWDGLGKPKDGDMYMDHQNLTYKVYFHGEFHEVDMSSPYAVEALLESIKYKDRITDEYLEEQYPELKALKEQYNEMRDKLTTFEILKKNEDE